jgi:two-component system, OmpR family, sensor histidine kinase TctE
MPAMPTPGVPRKPSLRSRVAMHVILPLALTWLVGTAIALGVANYFAQQAFDRSLLDDAYSVASNVKGEGAGLTLVLSPREINHVLFDKEETVFFAVLRPDGTLVAGHPGLHGGTTTRRVPYEFADITYQGKYLRSVRLHRRITDESQADFQVVLAQTRRSRDSMLQRLLVFSIVPQLLLLVVLALWLRRAIQSDLEPLARLQRAVDQRPAHDFESFNTEASTRDMQRLAQALNALLARIQASVRAQREFAGNVAHELRTPLAGIRALAAYGLARPEPEVWQQQLQSVLHSEARASHMVDQLLALALADEASAGVSQEALDVDVVVRDAVLRFLPKADAAGVDLGARGIDAPLILHANMTLLEGILNNLIDNALRYGKPQDGQAARVTVEVVVTDGATGEKTLRLSVIDNGPGVPPAQRHSLTQRWVRGSTGQRLEQSAGLGAGLGLAIVGQYAHSLGASLDLGTGDDGHGLRASVTFQKV